MSGSNHKPEVIAKLREQRKRGSLIELSEYPTGNTVITLFDGRFGEGYYAMVVARPMAAIMRRLNGEDLGNTDVMHTVDQPWFPGVLAATPQEALSALSAKVDSLDIEQFADVWGVGKTEEECAWYSDMTEIPHFTNFRALENWFQVK